MPDPADQRIGKFNQYIQAQGARYSECDSGGHMSPREDGTCGHCYRRLVYETPVTDRILMERRGLPLIDQPCDAPWLAEKRRQEIQMQETCDWISGIDKIWEEHEKH